MELIRWALELGESVHGNTYEELMPLLDYYYDRDHLKSVLYRKSSFKHGCIR